MVREGPVRTEPQKMRHRKPWEYLGQSVLAARTSSAKPPEVGFSKRLWVVRVIHRLARAVSDGSGDAFRLSSAEMS